MASHQAQVVPTGRRIAAALTSATERLSTFAGRALRGAPGVLGAGAVSIGVGMIYAPAGVIAAGVFLLLIDRDIG